MNRTMDICGICGAMQTVRPGGLAVPTVYACEDVGTHYIAGIKIYIDHLCTEEKWTMQEIPEKCRCYAEYFLADCNKDEAKK